MAAAVAILDALRKKPVAEKKKHFSVAFFVAPAKHHVQKEREEREEREERDEREAGRPGRTGRTGRTGTTTGR